MFSVSVTFGSAGCSPDGWILDSVEVESESEVRDLVRSAIVAECDRHNYTDAESETMQRRIGRADNLAKILGVGDGWAIGDARYPFGIWAVNISAADAYPRDRFDSLGEKIGYRFD